MLLTEISRPIKVSCFVLGKMKDDDLRSTLMPLFQAIKNLLPKEKLDSWVCYRGLWCDTVISFFFSPLITIAINYTCVNSNVHTKAQIHIDPHHTQWSHKRNVLLCMNLLHHHQSLTHTHPHTQNAHGRRHAHNSLTPWHAHCYGAECCSLP